MSLIHTSKARKSVKTSSGGGGGGGSSSKPVYDGGILDTMVLSDNFEGFADKTALLTYDFGLGRWLTNNDTRIEFPSSGGASSGTKALRLLYPNNAVYTDADVVLEGGLGPPSSNVPQYGVARFNLKTKSGYPWYRSGAADQDGAGEKTFIINQGDPVRFVLGCGRAPSGGPYWGGLYDSQFPDPGIVYSFDGSGVAAGTMWYFQNMNKATRSPGSYMNNGSYHEWVIKFTPGTFQNSTGGDGSLEMWVDDTKVLEYIGSDNTRPEYQQVLIPRSATALFNLLDIGGPFNGAPSPAQGDQWKDYDDVSVWLRY